MNIYDHVFTSAQVAKAADMTSANFRAQFTRKNWRIIGRERPGNGEAHLFTIYDALSYALARRLMEYGFAPSTAFDLAVKDFAHTGCSERDPGSVFDVRKYGRTFFVASLDSEQGRCVAQKGINDAIELFILPMANRSPDVVLIDLNDLRDRVFHALNLDARDYE